jgi:hypothetical protein
MCSYDRYIIQTGVAEVVDLETMDVKSQLVRKCYSDVTVVLHRCYSCETKVLQWCGGSGGSRDHGRQVTTGIQASA